MQASRPSDTAKLIARSLLLAAEDHQLKSLVPDDSVPALQQILERKSGRDWILPFVKCSVGRKILLCGERVLLPGIVAHYLVRKLRIEKEVEEAIASGCERVVVVGAGFDTLAWRLHRKHPNVQFVELDHPATQQRKKDHLEFGANLKFQSLDLVKELPSPVLQGEDVPTVFVIEGVTMYLTPVRVGALLQDVASVMGAGGRVVWTFMERDKKGSINFRGESSLISRWLHVRSEPFLWGITRDRLTGFLAACGLKQKELADHEILRRDYLRPRGVDNLPLAEGELISTANLL